MPSLGVATEWFPSILQTRRILDLVATAHRASPQAPVLIRGERGVGKDVLARLIHAASVRHPYAFIKVNCRTQEPARCRANLFGFEKGAAPDALRRQPGSFEYANHGTIFLDEVNALPGDLVPSLVHALRTGEVSRAGAGQINRVDVRVIASEVPGEAKRRADFWQSLCEFDPVEIDLPPLRERPEEIAIFASFFAGRFSRQRRRPVDLGRDVLRALEAHAWPGNIRELEEAIQRMIMSGSCRAGVLKAS